MMKTQKDGMELNILHHYGILKLYFVFNQNEYYSQSFLDQVLFTFPGPNS